MLLLVVVFVFILCLILIWKIALSEPANFKKIQQEEQDFQSHEAKHEHYVQIGRHNIHYETYGHHKNEKLLLIHGIGASVYIWRFLIPYLEAHFHIYAIDLPGFGRSSKDPEYSHNIEDQSQAIADFCKSIKISRCKIIASSMGATISLWLYKTRPDLVDYLFAVSPACDYHVTKKLNLKILSPTYSLFAKTLDEKWIAQILKPIVNNRALITPEACARYAEVYKNNVPAIKCFVAAFHHLLADKKLPSRFAGMDPNFSLIWGENDKMSPLKHGRKLQQLVPGSELIIHPTAGHHLMEDEPQWLAELVLVHK